VLHVNILKKGLLSSVVVSCSVSQCVAECRIVLHANKLKKGCLSRVLVSCSVLQCISVCRSVLQCVAVCCSVLQCVTHEHVEEGPLVESSS